MRLQDLGESLLVWLLRPDSRGTGHSDMPAVENQSILPSNKLAAPSSVSDPSSLPSGGPSAWSTGIPPFDRSDSTGNVVFIEIGARGDCRPVPDPPDNRAAELLCRRPRRFGRGRLSGWRIKA